ncbi:hypothetical protein VTL71DRAFT_4436 [Oculimacula yallundae]|uniref:Uncharacterized protein n=1 Tax=Oculimacula yallundae TaxID=86028 RepID=A0ABR4C2M5_9HELO
MSYLDRYLPSDWKEHALSVTIENDLEKMETFIISLVRWAQDMHDRPEGVSISEIKKKAKLEIMPLGETLSYGRKLQMVYWVGAVVIRWTECHRIRLQMEENVKRELQELLIERCAVLDLDRIKDQRLDKEFFANAKVQVVVHRRISDLKAQIKHLKQLWKALEKIPKKYNQFFIFEIPKDPRDPLPVQVSMPAVQGWGYWGGSQYWVDKDCRAWHPKTGYIDSTAGWNWWRGLWKYNRRISELSKMKVDLLPYAEVIMSLSVERLGSLHFLRKFNPEITEEERRRTLIKVSWKELHDVVKRLRERQLKHSDEICNTRVNPPEWKDEPDGGEAVSSTDSYDREFGEIPSSDGSSDEAVEGEEGEADGESEGDESDADDESEDIGGDADDESEGIEGEASMDPEALALSDADADGETDEDAEPQPKRRRTG